VANPTKNRRARAWLILRLLVGAALLLALLPLLADPTFWQTLAQVHLGWVAVGFLLSLLSIVSKAWRWQKVLAQRGIFYPLSHLLASYFISLFFNNFLPSGMGGDAVRAYQSAQESGRGATSIIAVVMERGSGMLAVFAAGSIGAFFVSGLPLAVALLAHGLLLGTLVALFGLWANRTERLLTAIGGRLPKAFLGPWAKLTSIYTEFRAYRAQWRLLRMLMLQSLLTLALTLASVYSLLIAFSSTATFSVAFGGFAAAFAIVTAIDILPISLNGIGVREGSYVFFLGLVGAPAAVALGVGLLVRLIVLLHALVGGLAYLWRAVVKQRVST
jgi:glycosyltransferase 2 family protein